MSDLFDPIKSLLQWQRMIAAQKPRRSADVVRDWWAPKDRVYLAADLGFPGVSSVVIVHPWYDMSRGEYRPPGWTRYSLGVREAERDKRKHGRGRV